MRVGRISGIGGVDAGAWRALEPRDFPFFDLEFLEALERSGSIGRSSGWQPAYLLCEGDGGGVLGALPVYLKTDSDPLFQFTRQTVRRRGGRIQLDCDNVHGSNGNLPGSGVFSAYEKAAVSQGATIKFLAFQLD